MPKNPTRIATKAVKKAGKALSVFEDSAAALEASSAHHLAAADGFVAKADALAELVDVNLETDLRNAEAAFDAANEAAYEKAADGFVRVFALDAAAEDNEEAAFKAQVQADSFRQLLAVA